MKKDLHFCASKLNIIKSLVCCLLLLPISSFAQLAKPAKFVFEVKLDVTGDDDIRSEVLSYLNRELRSLGDVTTVEENFEFLVSVIAISNKTVSGSRTGVTLSAVMLEKFQNSSLQLSMVKDTTEKWLISYLTKELYHPPNHFVLVDMPENLQPVCQKIVAKFDTEMLEGWRKVLRR